MQKARWPSDATGPLPDWPLCWPSKRPTESCEKVTESTAVALFGRKVKTAHPRR